MATSPNSPDSETDGDGVDLSGLRDVLTLLTNKWTVAILEALCVRPQRAGEITRRLGGIARKVQTDTLRAMERDGLIVRSGSGVPGTAVEYSITPLGATMRQVLVDLQQWSHEHFAKVQAAREAFDAREREVR